MSQRQSFNLRLGPGPGDHGIVVEMAIAAGAPAAVVRTRRRVGAWRAARRWIAAGTAAAIGGLVVLSVAAGSVSVAPPPAPTPRPGQSTPTPAPPALRVGNLIIQAPLAVRAAPVAAAESTPLPVPAADAAAVGEAAAQPAPAEADPEPAPPAEPPPPAAATGGFRLQLPFFQPQPRPTPIPQLPPAPPSTPDQPANSAPDPSAPSVLPVASPGALRNAVPPGSGLDDALRTASIANDQFNRGLRQAPPADPLK